MTHQDAALLWYDGPKKFAQAKIFAYRDYHGRIQKVMNLWAFDSMFESDMERRTAHTDGGSLGGILNLSEPTVYELRELKRVIEFQVGWHLALTCSTPDDCATDLRPMPLCFASIHPKQNHYGCTLVWNAA